MTRRGLLTLPGGPSYNAPLPVHASGRGSARRVTGNVQSLRRIGGPLLSRIRVVLSAQLLLVSVASVVFLFASGGFQAVSAGFGGSIAIINLLLLEWRRYRTDTGPAIDARQSLRVLYRSALERLVLVALLFALGLGALGLDPLALLTGFIGGQLALLLTGMKRTD
jgi:F0F1-type ATP synthase assembly protein I